MPTKTLHAQRHCCYCGNAIERGGLHKDHVFARSWYPEDTPENLAKLVVDCCRSCNNRKSKLDEDILVLRDYPFEARSAF